MDVQLEQKKCWDHNVFSENFRMSLTTLWQVYVRVFLQGTALSRWPIPLRKHLLYALGLMDWHFMTNVKLD